ncbi:MAG: hypothetical protein R8G66_27170 [Cytophagales bacterium]|nr:hypothetical protein [Cytophagales bacterium]
MKLISNFLLLFILSIPADHNLEGWELLSDVEVVRVYDDFLEQEVEKPEFSEVLKGRDKSEIELQGFVIPLNDVGSSDYFVLSRFPYQSCFFCGNAGPETVVEVYTNKSLSLKDQRVKVKGTLHLNVNDPLHLYYIMKDCTVELLDE